jgi:hypothetical protein
MKRTMTAIAFVVVGACAAEPIVEDAPETESGTLQPHGQVEVGVQKARAHRRMDVEQLDNTLKNLMDGMSWTTTGGEKEGDQFVRLRAPLGVPDFKASTHEDLSASILFAKFLEDAAVSVCNRRVEADLLAPMSHRVIVGNSDASPAKLEDLLLLFHGNGAPSAAELAIWTSLFGSANARAVTAGATIEQASAAGWKAVCVGLIEHPDFATY